MSKTSPPPAPSHLLRTHIAAVNAVCFSDDNERLYSGDASGTVVITLTRTLRPLASWKAHEDGILGIQEWGQSILTHGRDNKLHVWNRVLDSATRLGGSAVQPGLPVPTLRYSMDVNALNYCRFSLLPLDKPAKGDACALIALPNLVESSLADIWEIPSQKRLHAAIGKKGLPSLPPDGRGINAIGIIMSMHLFEYVHPNSSDRKQLRLLCAYENGSVTMWAFLRTDKPTSVEGIGWDSLWTVKLHVESVMAMTVSRDNTLALTVSADHLVGRYDLVEADQPGNMQTACVAHRTKVPGNASVAIRDDGKVCTIGGWDGRVRIYSTKSIKPLGKLDYHKKSCQTVAFARSAPISSETSDEDSDEDISPEEKQDRSRWLAVGSQDNRVSIWSLITFEKT